MRISDWSSDVCSSDLLDCISNFSFLQGASHPEELVQRAAQLGYEALALSDECSLAGVVRAWTEAKKQHIKLIIGSRFKLDGMHIIILASNLNGYGNLSELITLARRSCDKGDRKSGVMGKRVTV